MRWYQRIFGDFYALSWSWWLVLLPICSVLLSVLAVRLAAGQEHSWAPVGQVLPLGEVQPKVMLVQAGVGFEQVEMEKVAVGLKQGAVGLEPVAVGLGQVAEGLEKVVLGLEQVGVGLEKVVVGLEQVAVGLEQVAVGLEQAVDGLE